MSIFTSYLSHPGFHSLQPERHRQTLMVKIGGIWGIKRFRFPSNGKAQTNSYLLKIIKSLLSFNSLQTGRHSQTLYADNIAMGIKRNVSIPSNGKAQSDGGNCLSQWANKVFGFNSLQTGRHIQTMTPILCIWLAISFNSLQTGRHIQTVPISLDDAKSLMCFNSLQTGRHIQTMVRG